ncbi:MAG: flagellar M-ring protein FliF [Tissierellia bacterium]|nr:flagellar M-ring protein FliF [Tissierellia bacterium]
MPEAIQQLIGQLNEYWENTDKSKRRRIAIIGVIAILIILALSIIFLRTRYEVLYADLSLEDTGEITRKLDEMGIKWKTPNQNAPTTILVPADMKNKIKIELASDGLPREGYGFIDAFSDSSWMMTDYDKRQRMQLALQNELAATISEIDGIKNATVYINEKEETGFVLDGGDDATTASVSITKGANRPVKPETVAAIQNLVASAINAKPEKIQVIDNEGKLLTGDGNDTDFAMTDQFNIKDGIERKIDDSIRRFLENIFGYRNVDVRSSVKINFDSERTTIVEFSPPIEGDDEGLIRSMEEVEEHMVGGASGGIAGVESNPPEYGMLEDGSERYDKVSRIINNELNEINKEIKKTPGEIETITVAVLINRDALIDGEFTSDKEREISDLIYAATGLDTKQVEVRAEKFQLDDPVIAPEKGKYINWLILALLLVVAIGVTGYLIYRRRKVAMPREFEGDIEHAAETMPDIDDLELRPEESGMKTQVERFVERKPDEVAQLLRTWLNE